VPKIEQLLEHAARHGMGTLGLADLGGLYGAVQFVMKAREFDIKPILGVELETEAGTILFIAKDFAGYGNLCRLSTIARLDGRTPTLDDIAAYRSGLIAIPFDSGGIAHNAQSPISHSSVPSPQSLIPQSAIRIPHSPSLMSMYDIFADDLYFGLVNYGDTLSQIRLRKALRGIEKYNIKPVAANPVAFMRPDDYATHRVLRAIGEIVPVDQLSPEKCESPQAYFRGKSEYAKLFREFPEALTHTVEIAGKCNLDLPLGKLNFPNYENHSEKPNSRLLYELSFAGLQRRYPKLRGDAIARLEYELNVIERSGFTDYFLIVHDIIDFCRRERIPCVGRGSAASSIVSYCLGITEVCPIEQDLYFPRFLNEARRDPPDIDIDLCWKRRDDVLEYVYEEYGRDRVAMICTLNTFAVRGAIREVAKAFGLSGDEISDFTKRLSGNGKISSMENRIKTIPEAHHLPIHSEPYRSIIEIAARIEGYPRHLGIHSGGIVISPGLAPAESGGRRTSAGTLLDYVPLQMSAKGIAITQYDMYSIDDLGLVKIDLLGQRGLSTIEEARNIIAIKTGHRPNDIPEGDAKTYDLIRRGKTIGIFQIESPGLRALFIAMQPKELNDITLALSLIRPGASESGMKKIFLERLFGRLPVEYPHPCLEPVLKETLGNIIYQEQVLKVAEALAGFTPEQGDLLRRSMTKDRSHRDFAEMRQSFFRQAARRGVVSVVASHVFDMIAQFANYGFCKAHAATYAMLSYRGAYLKAHHPVEYMAAMLNNFAGYYQHRVYVEEARRFGARLRTPTIDRPSDVCFVDGDELYIGLLYVRNLSHNTINNIIAERPRACFTSLFDFLARVRPSVDEAESLIKCGALDCFGLSRPQLLWLMRVFGEKRLKHGENSPTLGGLSAPDPNMAFLPSLPDYDTDQRLQAEAEILEMSVTCHPMERIAVNNGHVRSFELPKLEGRRIKIMGLVADRKRIKTQGGKQMVFLSMEDQFDMFEVTLFPDIYQRVGERIFRKPILDIEGVVQTDLGGLTVVAEKVDVVE
jgi:DNA-directed DNA polymerase III PolC